MNKRLALVLYSFGVAVCALGTVASVSYAYYERGRVINNPQEASPTPLDIESDHANYINYTFRVSVTITNSKKMYVWGSFNNWSRLTAIKMTEATTNKWEVTVPLRNNTAIEYKFFAASDSDPGSGVQEDRSSNHSVTPDSSHYADAVDTNFVYRYCKFTINYDSDYDHPMRMYFAAPNNIGPNGDGNTADFYGKNSYKTWYTNDALTLPCAPYVLKYKFYIKDGASESSNEKHQWSLPFDGDGVYDQTESWLN